MKVAFVGLGKLGFPCSQVCVEKGHDVTGYDPVITKNNLHDAIFDREIVFVAVPTPHDPMYGGEQPTSHLDPKDFDTTIVEDVLTQCNEIMNKDQLLVLISTVLPTTNDDKLKKLITNTNYCYSPFFIAQGTVAWDFKNPEMYVIGVEDYTKYIPHKLIDFYKTIAENNPRTERCNFKEAESIKVFYNTYITQKINFVNMIQDVSDKMGNTDSSLICRVLSQCNMRLISDAYMKPGLGDGGSCHPRDNIALSFLAKKLNMKYDMWNETMRIREKQAETLALKILNRGKRIAFTSTGFKEGLENTDGSYILLIQHYIKENGGEIVDIDNCDILCQSYPNDKTPENTRVFDIWRKYGK